MAYASDGRRLLSGSEDRTVKVWHAGKGQELLTLRGHPIGVNGLAYSPDGQRFASCTALNEIHVWDASRGGAALLLPVAGMGVVPAAAPPAGPRTGHRGQAGQAAHPVLPH